MRDLAVGVAKPPAGRFDPLSLPSDTGARFFLLMVLVLASATYTFAGPDFLFRAFSGETSKAERGLRECIVKELCGSGVPIAKLEQRLIPCMAHEGPASSGVAGNPLVVSLVALLALAAVNYCGLPWWIRRRNALRRLPLDKVPELGAELRRLCEAAGLQVPPRFVTNPLDSTVNAMAFGRVGRYEVSLPGGVLRMFARDRDTFRAIVLHELGHVRNADVTRTYLTIAIWWAFVAGALLPYSAKLFAMNYAPDVVLAFAWRVVAVAALVYFMRNAVLRAREFYADARVGTEGGVGAALDRILERQAAGRRGAWARWSLLHPSPQERRAVLHDPTRLIHRGFWDGFGVGAATVMALVNLLVIPQLPAATGSASAAALPWAAVGSHAAVFVVVSLVLSTLGAGIWRSVAVHVATGSRSRSFTPLALGLGLGLAVGMPLSLVPGMGYFDPGFGLCPGATTGMVGVVFANGIVIAVLMAGAALLVFATAAFARRVSRVSDVRRIRGFGYYVAATGFGLVGSGSILVVVVGYVLARFLILPTVGIAP